MRRKYLDEIGVTDRWDEWEYEGEAGERFKAQREEWGFDARETFSLDWNFYQWLYERLIVYRDVGGKVVDLGFHKFEWKGKEYTQIEMIENLIEELRWALTEEDAWKDMAGYERLMDIGKMWAIILPAMWW